MLVDWILTTSLRTERRENTAEIMTVPVRVTTVPSEMIPYAPTEPTITHNPKGGNNKSGVCDDVAFILRLIFAWLTMPTVLSNTVLKLSTVCAPYTPTPSWTARPSILKLTYAVFTQVLPLALGIYFVAGTNTTSSSQLVLGLFFAALVSPVLLTAIIKRKKFESSSVMDYAYYPRCDETNRTMFLLSRGVETLYMCCLAFYVVHPNDVTYNPYLYILLDFDQNKPGQLASTTATTLNSTNIIAWVFVVIANMFVVMSMALPAALGRYLPHHLLNTAGSHIAPLPLGHSLVDYKVLGLLQLVGEVLFPQVVVSLTIAVVRNKDWAAMITLCLYVPTAILSVPLRNLDDTLARARRHMSSNSGGGLTSASVKSACWYLPLFPHVLHRTLTAVMIFVTITEYGSIGPIVAVVAGGYFVLFVHFLTQWERISQSMHHGARLSYIAQTLSTFFGCGVGCSAGFITTSKNNGGGADWWLWLIWASVLAVLWTIFYLIAWIVYYRAASRIRAFSVEPDRLDGGGGVGKEMSESRVPLDMDSSLQATPSQPRQHPQTPVTTSEKFKTPGEVPSPKEQRKMDDMIHIDLHDDVVDDDKAQKAKPVQQTTTNGGVDPSVMYSPNTSFTKDSHAVDIPPTNDTHNNTTVVEPELIVVCKKEEIEPQQEEVPQKQEDHPVVCDEPPATTQELAATTKSNTSCVTEEGEAVTNPRLHQQQHAAEMQLDDVMFEFNDVKPNDSCWNALDDEEDAAQYRPGGYHPVKVGEIFNEKYVALAKLGWGEFSTVWLARDKDNSSHFVALKISKADEEYRRASDYEIDVYDILNQTLQTQRPTPIEAEFVMRMYECFEHEGPNGNHLVTVAELLGPNLLKLIQGHNFRGIDPEIVKIVIRQVLCGLCFLHDHGIVHSDVKPENILLVTPNEAVLRLMMQADTTTITEDDIKRAGETLTGVYTVQVDESLEEALFRQYGAKISDLGSARYVDKQYPVCVLQTREYRAPEVLLGYANICQAADLWSVACMTFEMLTGDFLFDPKSQEEFDKDLYHIALYRRLLGELPGAFAVGGTLSENYYAGSTSAPEFLGPDIEPTTLKDHAVVGYGMDEAEAEALQDFLLPMLAYDPKNRATAREMLSHPWLRVEELES